MAEYYFLATALPPLQLEQPPDISYHDFLYLLQDNLTKSDLKKAAVIHRFYDIQNLKAFWKHEPLDIRGSLEQAELEEELVDREKFPDYIYEFIDKYDEKQWLTHYPELLSQFFRMEGANATGFLKNYLNFERDLRLILVGFRAKALKKDLVKELQFEDPYDDLVAQILAQKDANTYVPPENFQDLQPILESNKDPLELHKALCAYRFYKIEEMLGIDMFSIDRVLGYMVQLILVEQWHELDKTKGLETLKMIVGKDT